MNLLELDDNGEIIISAETLLVPEFKVLWDRDQVASIKLLKFIWFYCDTKSPCSTFEASLRLSESILNSELEVDYTPDREVLQAIAKYESYDSIATRMLKSTYRACNELINYFNTVDLTQLDPRSGKPIYSAKELQGNIKQTADLLSGLRKLEEQVRSEQLNQATMRGGGEIGTYESGFDEEDED